MMNGRSIEVVPLGSDNLDGLYHYTESGLKNYWLSPSLFEVGELYGDETVIFPKLDEMQAAIGLHICSLKRLLGPREVRFLRGELNYSQRELGLVIGYRDKQCVAKAERLDKDSKHLSASADLLLRSVYLNYLGNDTGLIGEDYRKEALKLGNDLQKPYPVDEKYWQLAA